MYHYIQANTMWLGGEDHSLQRKVTTRKRMQGDVGKGKGTN